VFYPQNAYVQGGHLVLKMEPGDIHHHRVYSEHSHYNAETHRQESEVAHMDRDPMVRDAVHPGDMHSYLGQLQPKVGGTQKPTRDYGPTQSGHHLIPASQPKAKQGSKGSSAAKKEDRSEPTSLNLKKRTDDKSSREITHDKAVKAHMSTQMHLPPGTPHEESDPMKRHLEKARHVETEFDTSVATIGHLDGARYSHEMYLAQQKQHD